MSESKKSILVSNDYLLNNSNEFYNVLYDHMVNYLKHSKRVHFFSIVRIILIVLLPLIIISLLTVSIMYTDGLIHIICSSLSLVAFSLLILFGLLLSNKISSSYNQLTNSTLSLEFEPNSYWQYTNTSNYHKKPILNLESNMGYLLGNIKYSFIVFPNFALSIQNNVLTVLMGNSLSRTFSFNSNIIDEANSLMYKYKEIESQRWQYERKDKTKDLRYKDNPLITHYRYFLMTICNYTFEIPNRQIYIDAKETLNHSFVHVNNKVIQYNLFNYSRKKNKSTDKTGLEAIEELLSRNNLLYRNYGELLEFEVLNRSYLISKSGKIINSKKKLSNLIGDKLK